MLTEKEIEAKAKLFSKDAPIEYGVAKFIRFLKRIHLREMLGELEDGRQQGKVIYGNHSLLVWALSTFFFRQGSKDAFNTTLQDLSVGDKESIARYMGIEGASLPHKNTVDEYLKQLDIGKVNNFLLRLFQFCQESKLFYNHAETLLPN